MPSDTPAKRAAVKKKAATKKKSVVVASAKVAKENKDKLGALRKGPTRLKKNGGDKRRKKV